MNCPFRYRGSRRNYSFGVDPEFMDWCDDQDRAAEEAFNRRYPTCWAKFVNWLKEGW